MLRLSQLTGRPGRCLPALLLSAILPGSGALAVDETPLPDSLDRYFPPLASEPIYLHAMMDLGDAYSGIQIDLQQDDTENARKNFERFQSLYREIRSWVPEWEARFPDAPVRDLERALQSDRPQEGLRALLALRRVCGECHAPNMVRVQFRYHWGNFRAITVTDPVSGEEVLFPTLKWSMQDDFSGLVNDARQLQMERARQQFEGFSARLDALATTCAHCHRSERKYYTDADTLEIRDRLRVAVMAEPPRTEEVARLARELNLATCFECHLVHMPAAFSRGH